MLVLLENNLRPKLNQRITKSIPNLLQNRLIMRRGKSPDASLNVKLANNLSTIMDVVIQLHKRLNLPLKSRIHITELKKNIIRRQAELAKINNPPITVNDAIFLVIPLTQPNSFL